MKKIKYYAIVLLIALIAVGAYFVKYEYCDSIVDVVEITYTPSLIQNTPFGVNRTKPRYEYSKVYSYNQDEVNEDVRVEKVRKQLLSARESYTKKIDEALQKKDETTVYRINALNNLIAAEKILVFFTHTRSYDSEDFWNMVKSKGIKSYDVENYIAEHSLNVTIRDI